MLCDVIGPLNSLLLALTLSALSLLVVWPVSTGLAPLALFVVVNGVANGGFFSTMPTVVGNVFGSARMGVAMGMVVTSWAGGYLMVSFVDLSFLVSFFSVSIQCGFEQMLNLTSSSRVLPSLGICWRHMVGRTRDSRHTGRKSLSSATYSEYCGGFVCDLEEN